jgi:hypothetical protein
MNRLEERDIIWRSVTKGLLLRVVRQIVLPYGHTRRTQHAVLVWLYNVYLYSGARLFVDST